MTDDRLLLIHAFPLDARMWEPQLAALGTRLPIVAPHLPGFGGTQEPARSMTMALAAEHCAARRSTRPAWTRAVVCGLSMGGYVGVRALAGRRGRAVAGLVLANTRAEPDPPEGAAGRRALAERLRSEGNGFLVEQPPPLLAEDAPEELSGAGARR